MSAISDAQERNQVEPSHRVDVAPSAIGVEISAIVAKLDRLSPRKKEVVNCVAADMSNDEIARELELSPSSVVTMMSTIYAELGVPRNVSPSTRRQYVKAAVLRLRGSVEESDAVLKEIQERPAAKGNGVHPVRKERVAPHAPHVGANGKNHADSAPHYGSGVPVMLSDPTTIVDIEVVSAEHESGVLASHIVRCRRAGLLPEVVVVFPTSDANVSHSHLIFVKRKS